MDMYFELCSMYLCYCMVGFFFALVELLPRVVPLVFLQTLPNNAIVCCTAQQNTTVPFRRLALS
jgi:hypothetical protein